jgi:hypothetical protein
MRVKVRVRVRVRARARVRVRVRVRAPTGGFVQLGFGARDEEDEFREMSLQLFFHEQLLLLLQQPTERLRLLALRDLGGAGAVSGSSSRRSGSSRSS